MLYSPPAFKSPDPVALVRRYSFAQLITATDAGVFATATPIFFANDTDTTTMIGHMARNNPHATALTAGQAALAIFAGPHTYISSSWYRSRLTVPTWNYIAAHVRGVLEPIDDAPTCLDILRRTAEVLEGGNVLPWTLDQAPPGKVDALMPGIRGFRLAVTSIEGVEKLNQTHPPADRMRVIRELLERGDGGSVDIARLMARIQPLE